MPLKFFFGASWCVPIPKLLRRRWENRPRPRIPGEIGYDAGITRISLSRIQKLSGKQELWSVCNGSLDFETPQLEILLRLTGGLPVPKGSERQIKQAYVDFRDSVEYTRSQMSKGEYRAQPYTGPFPRVRSMGEFLSTPHKQGRCSWLGPDAAPTQCSEVD